MPAGTSAGAVAVNWNTDLQDPLRRDFIAPEQFAKLQDTLGITPDTTVILYGGNNNWFAAYAYWYYKVYGHGTSGCWTAAARPGSWRAAS